MPLSPKKSLQVSRFGTKKSLKVGQRRVFSLNAPGSSVVLKHILLACLEAYVGILTPQTSQKYLRLSLC